ncbi:MAG: bifunctional (p)ppGpp synthetase/guanosine-3',5'-bis(diphosphate) 3'-pyrophosphohydrolase, partial [Spongiibacteraceae bacterium]|nr:bifunctional (p)ppGpp synthetase/guanosine-3',5'-bis(diphosphate) 3'-pyrophosphohydrolase [Spongiibacteraceae bacterium]
MVKVREDHPAKADGSIDLERWVERLAVPAHIDRSELLRACRAARDAAERAQADPQHAWGHDASSLRTGLEMAEILADLHLDQGGLIAAILYRAVREGTLDLKTVEAQFGAPIAKLIEGVLRMAAISRVNTGQSGPILGQVETQSDTVRKMLVALIDDVRVALIKLAERTCAIRAVGGDQVKRERVAREVADIYAPLAHRLGIGHIKWELEDLAFRYLRPDAYKKIARLLDERRLDRQDYIADVQQQLSEALQAAGIEAELSGRAKHIYSIWRKMQRKGIGFSQVYDIRAVRILVHSIKDCYAALGVVHGLWRNVPNEFDDYIANPKDNGYRSLHTAVIGPGGKVLEVQIRTLEMHEEAELGVCAHWRYKGADNQRRAVASYEEKIAWLRQVLEWHEEAGGSADVAEQFSRAQDRVYVFTPDGHVVNLAQGSTPLDFAYHIHTQVGHRCRGAKVNGRIVPLSYQLRTGEQVEILTGKEDAPRRDWLQPNLGYLKSARARAKVQAWFRQQKREDNITAGRALIEREFRRLALTSLDYKAVAERVRCATVEEMYAALGSGEVSAAQVLNAAQALVGIERPEPQPVPATRRRTSTDREGDVRISGVGNLLTHIAGCCKPVPGDAIVGYITVG